MTAPAIDGRTWIERARELAKKSPFEIHEEPSRALDVIRAMLPVVEAALEQAKNGNVTGMLLAAVDEFETIERKDYR